MQPFHAIDDGKWAAKRLDSVRLKRTYVFRSLLESNANLTFGSDWPVAPLDPIAGIYAAVTRRTLDDKNPEGWFPEQKITVEQALALLYRKQCLGRIPGEENRKIESRYAGRFYCTVRRSV